MASRSDRKKRYRTAKTALRGPQLVTKPLGNGMFELSINFSQSTPPETTFYANTATVTRHGQMVSMIFGQVTHGTEVDALVRFDMRVDMVAGFLETFVGLKERMADIDAKFSEPLLAFPKSPRPKAGAAYPAHLARVLVNDFMTLLDFYEFLPVEGGEGIVNPLMRISGYPQLLSFVYKELARSMGNHHEP